MKTEFYALTYQGDFVDTESIDTPFLKSNDTPHFLLEGQSISKILSEIRGHIKRSPHSSIARNRLENIKKCKVVKVRIEIIE